MLWVENCGEDRPMRLCAVLLHRHLGMKAVLRVARLWFVWLATEAVLAGMKLVVQCGSNGEQNSRWMRPMRHWVWLEVKVQDIGLPSLLLRLAVE